MSEKYLQCYDGYEWDLLMHLFIFVVPEVYVWPLGEKKKQHFNIRQEKQNWHWVCCVTWGQPDLKDGGNK